MSKMIPVNPISLADLLQPGNVVRVCFRDVGGRPNRNNAVLHVRAIVDEDIIVTREWSKGRRSWVYVAEHWEYYQLLLRDGALSLVRRERCEQ